MSSKPTVEIGLSGELHERQSCQTATEMNGELDDVKKRLLALQVQQVELRRQNQALQKSLAHGQTELGWYIDLYEFAPASYITFDREGLICQLNLTAAHLLGGTRDSLLGKNFSTFVAPSHQTRFNAFLEQCFIVLANQSCEIELVINGQATLTVQIEATVFTDQKECRVVLVDITARKKAERALSDVKERLTRTFDSINEGLIVQDHEGRIIDCNPAAVRILGLCLDEIPGCQSFEACYRTIHEDGSEFFKEAYPAQVAIHTGQPVRDVIMGVLKPSGSLTWISINAEPFFGASQHPEGVVCSFSDITARKRVDDHLCARNSVLELVSKGAPLSDVLHAIVRGVEKNNPAVICSILLLNSAGKRFLIGAAPNLPDFYNSALQGFDIGLGAGSCGTAAFTGQRVIVEDIQTHPYWAPYKELATQAGLAACWSEPIRDSARKVLGSFAVYHRTAAVPSGDDIAMIEQYARMAALAIERIRNEESMQLAALVYRHSSEAMMVCDADKNIIAINPAFTQLTGYTADDVLGKNPRLLSSGRHSEAFHRAMTTSLNVSGQWRGEIWNRRKNGEFFAESLTINTISRADGSIHRYVAQFSDITQKKASEELIWRQANYDSLTRLPNRSMFRERLELDIKNSKLSGLPLAILFIDLDRFKEINDTLGHAMGDILLIEAARRIRDCVAISDIVARAGGDEFTIILSRLDEIGKAAQTARNIIDALVAPFQLGDDQVFISASIGITLYPNDAVGIDDLLKHADQAMYVAKEAGRNRFSYFTPALQVAAQARMRLTNDLRGALEGNRFKVYFQPIVHLATGRIHKAEALIRWQHPLRGLISPADFIPLAEATGLIIEIGEWVFKEAVRWVKRWRTGSRSDFQISVNQSPLEFQREDRRHAMWLAHLKELDLPGQCIVVEITEGLLLEASVSVTDKLLELRDAGIQVALDDFGTGYSSLSYLKKFDIDYLKIDQSFVRNLTAGSSDLALSEAIIVMAHKLGLKVIAEGVETAEQRDLLNAAGCDYGQGYLFARPMPAEEFDAMLQSGQPIFPGHIQ